MYLGIDLGTSAVKCIAVDREGRVQHSSSAALEVSRLRAGWSEQEPESWWRACEAAVLALPAEARAATEGIGLSGQMHGATLLDTEDRVLRPAILWNDGRSTAQCEALSKIADFEGITGNLVMPGFTAPKLQWVREHEPEVFARTCSVLLPKDYLRLRMSGDRASDLSDSAGTLWLDVAKREWSEALLDATGLDAGAMPALFEGNAPTGTLRAKIASRWGISERAVIAAGAGDNAAGAIGIAALDERSAFVSLGTSGVIFVPTSEFRPNPAQAVHAFCHALPNRWHQMSVILSAASCVAWVTRLAGFDDEAAAVAAAESAETSPLFLPYLSGERTPHNDANARGVFFGLSHDTDPGRLVHAVLEGVAFALADGLDALREAGSKVSTLTVIGGGARSELWGRLLAAALRCRLVYRSGATTGPAYGAARLGRLAATGEGPENICTPPPVEFEIEADPAEIDRAQSRRERFAALYRDLRPHFGANA